MSSMVGSEISKAELGTLFHGSYIDTLMLAKVRVIEVPESSRGKPLAKHGFFMDLFMLDAKRAILLYACEEQSEWKDWMERVFF